MWRLKIKGFIKSIVWLGEAPDLRGGGRVLQDCHRGRRHSRRC